MSIITNKKNLPEGWHVASQTPVDDRLVFANESDLINLGVDNQEAYRYYEGMRVWVINTRKEYEWKESPTGSLSISFTYPSGAVSSGIVYSGRAFNFVESGGSAGGTTGPGGDSQSDTVNLLAGIALEINIADATAITNVRICAASGEDITNGINIFTSSNTVTLESNVSLVNLIVKTTF